MSAPVTNAISDKWVKAIWSGTVLLVLVLGFRNVDYLNHDGIAYLRGQRK